MEIKRGNWQATYLPGGTAFSVSGDVYLPDIPLEEGVIGYMETKTSLSLYQFPSEDATILRLHLAIEMHPEHQKTNPRKGSEQEVNNPVRYHREPLAPEEHNYKTVEIFYEGRCIETITVLRM